MKILEVYDCEERGGWKFAMVKVRYGFPLETAPFINSFSWFFRKRVRRVAVRGRGACFMDTGEELGMVSTSLVIDAMGSGGCILIPDKARRVRDAQAAYLVGADTAGK